MYGGYLDGGAFAPYVTARRFAGSRLVGMIEVAQPAGDFSDPATDNLVVGQALTPVRTRFDNGFARFDGVGLVNELTLFRPNHAAPILADGPHRLRLTVIPVPELRRLDPDPSEALVARLMDHARATFRSPTVARQLDALWGAAGQADLAGRIAVEAAALGLVAGLLRAVGRPASARGGAGLAPWQLARTQAYMLDHMDARAGLAEVAALVGLSPSHFCTAFRRSTGLPPRAWLARARIERAKGLLADPRLSITEVAQAVAYAGQSAFGAAFRRLTGSTPRSARRLVRP
jgi:AraC family transcriptional regulator